MIALKIENEECKNDVKFMYDAKIQLCKILYSTRHVGTTVLAYSK